MFEHRVAAGAVRWCFAGIVASLLLSHTATATLPPTLTPTPTATPGTIQITVVQPAASGLVPVAGTAVSSNPCFQPTTCLDDGQIRSAGSTDSNGIANLPVFFLGAVTNVLRADIGGVFLRSLALSETTLVIDPISEAAVRLIDMNSLDHYDMPRLARILTAVRDANAGTDFAGLSLDAAVELAMTIAVNDPVATAALQDMITPTPTYTPITPTSTATRSSTPTPSYTPTPTATNTRLPTAAPLSCLGDCDGDGQVTINELITAVNEALGTQLATGCPYVTEPDGVPAIDDLVTAVNNALNQCTARAGLPDLVPYAIYVDDAATCGALPPMQVCVANIGEAPAAATTVFLNDGEDEFTVGALKPGETQCIDRPRLGGDITVTVDAADDLAEAREDNNRTTFQVPFPPEVPTCTPTLTPTRPPSPTAT